jgi:bacterioferritin (cytochrome b1)
MEKISSVKTPDDAVKLMTVALKHEWAVSFEYVIHAYSMPKGVHFYDDPVMKQRTDIRAQTIQIGIDEMYHALQLGIVLTQMGIPPSFETDEILRFPRIIDNLRRDKMTEEMVTDLYQSAGFEPGLMPKIENMAWNISYDEVRHIDQFQAMIDALEKAGNAKARIFEPHPQRSERPDLRLIHEIMRLENAASHHDLKGVMMFSGHQDLTQRLYKNSINHMRHWDKLSGLLVKLGDVVAIEKAEKDAQGVERSLEPMPAEYPGADRLSILESLLPPEKDLVAKYEAAVALVPAGEVQNQLRLQLGLTREHVFTQEKLLADARKIKGLV